MDQIPAIDPAIRNQIQQELTINGIDWLQEQVQNWTHLIGRVQTMANNKIHKDYLGLWR